jgi:hypothetical protein
MIKLSVRQQLEKIIKDDTQHTIGDLSKAFGEKSFAFLFLILMILPALPLPTGGITHVLEVIVIILAAQLLVGRQNLWLPRSLKEKSLPMSLRKGMLSQVNKKLIWIERHSKRRAPHLVSSKLAIQFNAFIIIIMSLLAIIAPPFTGLDTLPSLSIVFISLAIILDDFYLLIVGYIAGLVGGGLIAVLGLGFIHLVSNYILH